MVFVLAPDSFKESLTAKQACLAMEKGIKTVFPTAKCIHVPLADGGEGTMQTIVNSRGGDIYQIPVMGPLGNIVTGEYAILGDGKTAVIELASASGLHLVPLSKRNPLITTTYGTGELIRKALSHGITKLIIGLGGSATNDGGAGIATALGIRFLDSNGMQIEHGGGNLHKIATIACDQLIQLPPSFVIEAACDVKNLLTGKHGASEVYAPQKGASPEMVKELDDNLLHYASKIKECIGNDISHIPGVGAAGGAAASLIAFFNTKMISGIEMVMNHTDLEGKISAANYVLTGEGKLDSQVLFGKTISGVISLASKYQKPIIAFAGKIEQPNELYQIGLTAAIGIIPGPCSLEEALKNGERNLENAVISVCRLLPKI